MLWLYRRVIFGEIVNDEVREMDPLEPREYLIFMPMTILDSSVWCLSHGIAGRYGNVSICT